MEKVTEAFNYLLSADTNTIDVGKYFSMFIETAERTRMPVVSEITTDFLKTKKVKKVVVFGGLYGRYGALIKIINDNKLEPTLYIFNGNYATDMYTSLLCIILLFALRARYGADMVYILPSKNDLNDHYPFTVHFKDKADEKYKVLYNHLSVFSSAVILGGDKYITAGNFLGKPNRLAKLKELKADDVVDDKDITRLVLEAKGLTSDNDPVEFYKLYGFSRAIRPLNNASEEGYHIKDNEHSIYIDSHKYYVVINLDDDYVEKDIKLMNTFGNTIPTVNIEKETLENENYRKVVLTKGDMQIVVMSLKPKEKIDREIHPFVTQTFRVEKGKLRLILDDTISNDYVEGDMFIVKPNTYHKIENVGTETAKFYTIYSPPQHKPDTIHKTYEEAKEAEKDKIWVYSSTQLYIRENVDEKPPTYKDIVKSINKEKANIRINNNIEAPIESFMEPPERVEGIIKEHTLMDRIDELTEDPFKDIKRDLPDLSGYTTARQMLIKKFWGFIDPKSYISKAKTFELFYKLPQLYIYKEEFSLFTRFDLMIHIALGIAITVDDKDVRAGWDEIRYEVSVYEADMNMDPKKYFAYGFKNMLEGYKDLTNILLIQKPVGYETQGLSRIAVASFLSFARDVFLYNGQGFSSIMRGITEKVFAKNILKLIE